MYTCAPQAVRRSPLQLVEAILRDSFGVVVPKEAVEGHLVNVKNRGERSLNSIPADPSQW